jgi:MOSC domain-containing protein YiiM
MGEANGAELKALMRTFAHAGRVEWIGLRPAHRTPVRMVRQAQAIRDHGLEGDRRLARGGTAGSKRQVTLIQHEHLLAVAAILDRGDVDPALLRRNVVVSGLNLMALKDCDFRIGHAVLRYTGLCHPCSRMEEVLGQGGYNAMRGHGGITAAVVEGGDFAVGDGVLALAESSG